MKNITIKNISLIVLSAVTAVFFCFGCKNSVDTQDFSSAVNKAQKKKKKNSPNKVINRQILVKAKARKQISIKLQKLLQSELVISLLILI